jgi:CubicO group peptidase (beta-lactamase class C family)
MIAKSFSQTKDTIDQYVEKAMAENHIPGAAIAIIKNGKILKEGYYGFANLEDSTPVTGQSVFEIASMSKQFTCAAILLLQQDGKISVNDLISKYLDSLPSTWQNITVKQLMNHTSGLRDDWDEKTGYFLENYTDEKMFSAQKKVPLRFKPGETWHYSSGPFDLGLIIKKITGKTYAQFLKERIFRPLGMNSSSVYDNRQIIPHRVAGYVWNDSLHLLQNGYDISPAAEARGDVGVITSVSDMIKWDAALKDDRLLNAESRKEMFEPGILNDGTHIFYGYGWFVIPHAGHLMIEHSGGFRTGFVTDIMRFPDIDLDVIVFRNQWTGGISSTQIAAIADTSIKLLSKMQLQKDPDIQRTQTLNTLIENIVTKKGRDTAMYKRIFLGSDPQEMNRFLTGFKGLTYMDSMNLQSRPIIAYGEKITKIIYYGTVGSDIKFLSFYFNNEDKLVCVIPDQDF